MHNYSKTNEQSMRLKEALANVAQKHGYVPDEVCISKSMELSEALSFNSICFIVGPPGCGKSTVRKILAQAYHDIGQKVVCKIIYPEALSLNEFSTILRTSLQSQGGKSVISSRENGQIYDDKSLEAYWEWIIIDGNMNPEMIETLMKGTDKLTSNDQNMTPSKAGVRLLLELTDMKHVPSSIFTKGVLISMTDENICWKAYWQAWIEKNSKKRVSLERVQSVLIDDIAKSVFQKSFKQISHFIEQDLHKYQYALSSSPLMVIQTTCTIISALLEEHLSTIIKMSQDQQNIAYQGIYLFAVMWGLGGSFLTQDNSQKLAFDKIWRENMQVKYPDKGFCFDYYFDIETLNWVNWNTILPKPSLYGKQPVYYELFVETKQTTRLKCLLGQHVKQRRPFLLVGSAGVGKTVFFKDYLNALNSEKYKTCYVNLNKPVTSQALKRMIESNRITRESEKDLNKYAVYFIDDLNLALKTNYETSSPLGVIREFLDLNEDNLTKNVLTACLDLNYSLNNPLDKRTYRHFSVFTMAPPIEEDLKSIFNQVLDSSFANLGQRLTTKLADATLLLFNALHNDPTFSDSNSNNYSGFNLRDFNQIIQSLMLAPTYAYQDCSSKLFKLWIHECRRVFESRSTSSNDSNKFSQYLQESYLQLIDDNINHKSENLFDKQIFFTSLLSEYYGTDKSYLPTEDLSEIKSILEEKLIEYNNQTKGQISLEFFYSTITHIIRICRILDMQGAHGLLLGVPRSGRKCLAKLSAFLCNMEVHEIAEVNEVRENDFRAFLKEVIIKCIKSPYKQRVLLITEAQLQDESLLAIVDELLSFGFVPDLFSENEIETLLKSLQKEQTFYKQGTDTTYNQHQSLIIDKIKRNLHILITLSPTGRIFTYKLRDFPCILKYTITEWFCELTDKALLSLAELFLQESEIPSVDICQSIGSYMEEYNFSKDIKSMFMKVEFNSLRTKHHSFLQSIRFWIPILRGQPKCSQFYLFDNGPQTIDYVKEKVKESQKNVETKIRKLAMETKEIESLTTFILQETEAIKIKAKPFPSANQELEELRAEAQPILDEVHRVRGSILIHIDVARQALKDIVLKDFYFIMSFANPPVRELNIFYTISLFINNERFETNGTKRCRQFRVLFRDPKALLNQLLEFQVENMTEKRIREIRSVIAEPESENFDYDRLRMVSGVAAELGRWVLETLNSYEIFRREKPIFEKMKSVEEEVRIKQNKVNSIQEYISRAESHIKAAKNNIEEARAKKLIVEEDLLKARLDLKMWEKLVLGLALTKVAEQF